MVRKTAITIMAFSVICSAKPISEHTLLDIECSPVEAISEKAEIVLPCTIRTVDGKTINSKNSDVSVRFKKDSNGIVAGRVEKGLSIDCSTRAAMIGFDSNIDSTNTFIALDDASKECFLGLLKQ